MVDREVQRRLAAILAADVEGYSRLIGADEVATIRTMRGHREVTDRLIGHYGGRIANTAGDSIIAVFDSAVEAVRAAVAIQAELAPLNAELPEERQVRFRIGINLGDVILDGDDVLGDGVNIAARLEGLTEAGGICISHNIYDQVSDKLHYTYADLGEQHLKNINQPVRVYRIVVGGSGAAAPLGKSPDASITQLRSVKPKSPVPAGVLLGAVLVLVGVLAGIGWYWQDTRSAGADPADSESPRAALSIVVLPFVNRTGNPENEYFADGITESLTADLGRIQQAFVVNTATAFAYKDKPTDAHQIGKELGVRYVLQGSVQRNGDKIRINAQLADTETNAQLWTKVLKATCQICSRSRIR